jgi:hypothetical protein
MPFPDTADLCTFLAALREGRSRHVFLSRLNPRDTAESTTFINGWRTFAPITRLLWWRTDEANKEVQAMFLELSDARLDKEMARLKRAGGGPCTP